MAARVRETEIAANQSHVLLHTVGPRNLDELEAAFEFILMMMATVATFREQDAAVRSGRNTRTDIELCPCHRSQDRFALFASSWHIRRTI